MMKNLIDFENYKLDDFEKILKKAAIFKKGPRVPFFLPETKVVANLFLEPSTRTRVSFEAAQYQLGLKPIYIDETGSSVKKGESLYDTLRTLQSIGVSACVIRTKMETVSLKEVAKKLALPIINAGSGITAHPTQALLDLFTIYERFERLNDLKIAFVGDISHSRVVASHLQMWKHFNNDIKLCSVNGANIKGYENSDIESEIEDADVLYLLRVQEERHEEKSMISNDQYHATFGLTEERYSRLKPSAIVMHPGPFIRDKEIASSLTEKQNVMIDQQVENGVFIRMAVLDEIFGGKASESLLNT